MRDPAFVFDIGNVLLKWDRRRLYLKIFNGDGQRADYFLNHICTVKWNEQLDRGVSYAEAAAVLARQYPEWDEAIRAYDTRWEEMIPGPIQATVDLLPALKAAGYPLYALSNWAEEKYAIVRPRYDFFALFDGVLLSSQVRLLKPDPRIFRLFLEQSGRQAETCVYIDDTLENIVAARDLGFQAIHFQSGEQLQGQLKHFLRKPGI